MSGHTVSHSVRYCPFFVCTRWHFLQLLGHVPTLAREISHHAVGAVGMRKCLVGIMVLLSGLWMPVSAQESNIYYGIGLTDGSIEVPGNGSRSLGTVAASVGTQITDRVGLELAFGAGSDEPGSIFSEPLMQYQAGLVRFSHAWSNKEVYLLFGHARLDVDSRLNPVHGGNAWGFGINLFGSKHTAINAHVLNMGGGALTSAGIGIQYFVGGLR